MMSKIDSQLVEEGAAIYYTDNLRNILESHMTYLRNAATTTVMNVSPMDAYRAEGDMNGLLLKIGISLYLHWVVMRLNNFTSPQDVPPDLTQLLMPAPSEVEMIRQSVTTASRIR